MEIITSEKMANEKDPKNIQEVTYIPRIAQFEKVSFEEFRKAYNKYFPGHDNTKEDELYIQHMYENIKIPTRSTKGSSGYDISTPIGFRTERHSITIPTGIRCWIAEGWNLWVLPRSSFGFKTAGRLVNTIGVFDSDYYYSDNEGHIILKITPHIFHDKIDISMGDRFCQGIFIPFGITKDDNVTNQRNGGIGSTGR